MLPQRSRTTEHAEFNRFEVYVVLDEVQHGLSRGERQRRGPHVGPSHRRSGPGGGGGNKSRIGRLAAPRRTGTAPESKLTNSPIVNMALNRIFKCFTVFTSTVSPPSALIPECERENRRRGRTNYDLDFVL